MKKPTTNQRTELENRIEKILALPRPERLRQLRPYLERAFPIGLPVKYTEGGAKADEPNAQLLATRRRMRGFITGYHHSLETVEVTSEEMGRRFIDWRKLECCSLRSLSSLGSVPKFPAGTDRRAVALPPNRRN